VQQTSSTAAYAVSLDDGVTGGILKPSTLMSLKGQKTLSLLKMYEPNLRLNVAFRRYFFHFKGKIKLNIIQRGSHLTKI
jgi:hypothetical protein